MSSWLCDTDVIPVGGLSSLNSLLLKFVCVSNESQKVYWLYVAVTGVTFAITSQG